MQQIGEAAGFARATPAYFFRSKDALYQAVLARVVARAEKELASAHDRGRGRSPEEAVTSYVNALVDLLGRDQTSSASSSASRSRRGAAWPGSSEASPTTPWRCAAAAASCWTRAGPPWDPPGASWPSA